MATNNYDELRRVMKEIERSFPKEEKASYTPQMKKEFLLTLEEGMTTYHDALKNLTKR